MKLLRPVALVPSTLLFPVLAWVGMLMMTSMHQALEPYVRGETVHGSAVLIQLSITSAVILALSARFREEGKMDWLGVAMSLPGFALSMLIAAGTRDTAARLLEVYIATSGRVFHGVALVVLFAAALVLLGVFNACLRRAAGPSPGRYGLKGSDR